MPKHLLAFCIILSYNETNMIYERDFQMAISTHELENRIDKAKTWDEMQAVLQEIPKDIFNTRVFELCEKYGKTLSQVQTESGIAKSTFYAIVNGTRRPTRNHIIIMVFTLGATYEELNELLKLARHKELYAKDKTDAIIMFGLKNKKKLEEIVELLESEGISDHNLL